MFQVSKISPEYLKTSQSFSRISYSLSKCFPNIFQFSKVSPEYRNTSQVSPEYLPVFNSFSRIPWKCSKVHNNLPFQTIPVFFCPHSPSSHSTALLSSNSDCSISWNGLHCPQLCRTSWNCENPFDFKRFQELREVSDHLGLCKIQA